MDFISPGWVPDGRFIAAIPLDSLKLMLFEIAMEKWTELVKIFVAYLTLSRGGRYVYFNGAVDNQEGYYRVQVSDNKLEQLFSMKGFEAARGAFGDRSRPGRDSAVGARRQHPGNLRTRLGDALIEAT
jgi:hypothetical protein